MEEGKHLAMSTKKIKKISIPIINIRNEIKFKFQIQMQYI